MWFVSAVIYYCKDNGGLSSFYSFDSKSFSLREWFFSAAVRCGKNVGKGRHFIRVFACRFWSSCSSSNNSSSSNSRELTCGFPFFTSSSLCIAVYVIFATDFVRRKNTHDLTGGVVRAVEYETW